MMTTITETFEQHYSIPIGSERMWFVRRPVSVLPDEGAIAFVDNGPREGKIARYSAANFKDGKWRGVDFEPTHWTVWK